MSAMETTHGNGARRTTEGDPRLWWLIVARGVDLELRRRRDGGRWRMRCPVDDSHEVTLVNGTHPQGIALTSHGPIGTDSPGHSLSVHRRMRATDDYDERYPDLYHVPYPCRFCGCAESMVLAALGARGRDKYRQVEAQREGRCSCGASGYRVGTFPVLCLSHLAERVGVDRAVLFEEVR